MIYMLCSNSRTENTKLMILDEETKMEFERKKLEFEKSLYLRNFEIDNFWKRGWFFGALLLALIAGLISLRNAKGVDNSFYCICISFVALLVSLGQSLMNRGSKYWQERWEYVTKNKESALEIDVTKTRKFKSEIGDGVYNDKYYIDVCIRDKSENWLIRSSRFSVSKITILIWDVITIFFLFIWLDEIKPLEIFKPPVIINYKALLFHLVILIYLILVVVLKGKLYENLLNKKPIEPESSEETHTDSEDFVQNNEQALRSK